MVKGIQGTGSTLITGSTNVTTAGTAVILTTSQSTISVLIQAKITNAGAIYVGKSNVTAANGIALEPGEAVAFDYDHSEDNIFIDSTWNGDGVKFILLK